MKNWVLTILSLVFYAWGEPICVLLLIVQALVGYAGGLIVQEARNQARKLALGLTATVILSMLAVFKYTDFFLANFNLLTGMNVPLPGLALPIGISFYTFRTISYITDVYRQKITPTDSLLEYVFFLTFFPCLVAGPITRASEFLPQLRQQPDTTPQMVYGGLWLVIIGIIKKAIVADYIAQYCNIAFGNPTGYSGVELLAAIIGYAIQIYFDFSGYSDMAIGLGRMFGFHFLENFTYPFLCNRAT